jgi:hypothetical protein
MLHSYTVENFRSFLERAEVSFALTEKDAVNIRQEGFGLDQTQAENVRPNVSLISWAAQFGGSFAQQLAGFVLVTNMDEAGRFWPSREASMQYFVQSFARNETTRKRMRELLRNWDLGLSDVLLQEHEVRDANAEIKKEWFAFGVHRDGKHKTHLLPLIAESSGTHQAELLTGEDRRGSRTREGEMSSPSCSENARSFSLPDLQRKNVSSCFISTGP